MFKQALITGLVKPKYQPIVELYIKYLESGYEHFNSAKVAAEIKAEKIRLLERAIRRDYPVKNNMISRLQQCFVTENLSLYLLIDPLLAWRYPAADKQPTSETQLSDIIGYETSPLARLLMVLNNENPSTYLPMQSLLAVLIYSDMFQNKHPVLKNIKLSKRQRLSKLRGLLKNAGILLSIVRSKRLKYRAAILLNTASILADKYEKNQQFRIDFLDVLRIYLYSIIQFLFVRKRTVTKKGI